MRRELPFRVGATLGVVPMLRRETTLMSTAEVEQQPQVTFSDDHLFAYLKVEGCDGEQPSMLDALEKLSSAHVSFGIDQERVQAALDRPGLTVLVARGRPPVD